MTYFSSNNRIVDEMGTINITGNVIPQIWYSKITRENGKPYLLAITLLADIVYWYRPSEQRDEQTGKVIGWRKRFKGDLLQKTYQQYANLYGESKRSVKAAIDCLIKLGVIKRFLRDVTFENGIVAYNLMYIELVPTVLKQLTYPEFAFTEKDMIIRDGGKKEMKHGMVQNFVTPHAENGSIPINDNVLGHALESTTNTEITTKTTYKDSFYQSLKGNEMNETSIDSSYSGKKMSEDEIVEYYELDEIQAGYEYANERDKIEALAGIKNLIFDILNSMKPSMRVEGEEKPIEVIKARLMKLNPVHIIYVVDKICEADWPIPKRKAYLTTLLYNAVDDYNHWSREAHKEGKSLRK